MHSAVQLGIVGESKCWRRREQEEKIYGEN